ncbi:NAD(P)-dependent alcohol dehydrogenase [Microbacterium soli]|uniref:NAD(P)-dependent alcohol dehydrogenase n=1 Tax=Microbacterium soli TaxID=446075 RepID=A0ABP7MPU0_9MICO
MSAPVHQRAVIQQRFGPVEEVLSWTEDLPVRPPQAGQVQVRVEAAGINPIDWQMIQGNRRLITPRRFPFIPLFDIAGTVSAVGSGVTRFRIGDRVHGDNHLQAGGASEYANVDESLLNEIPAGLDFADAAAVPLAAQTALAVLDAGGVTNGSRVAVIGASGGVGTFIVQMLRSRGARIVAVSSSRNHALVRTLGADDVIDHRTTTLADSYPLSSFDTVIDCVGGRDKWLQARRVLRRGGSFVTISRDEDETVTPASALRMLATIGLRRLRGMIGARIKYIPVFLRASADLLGRVDAMVDDGGVAPQIAARFPFTLEGVHAALARSRTGRTPGKIVIEMTHAGAPL